jgi:hypothetical protein
MTRSTVSPPRVRRVASLRHVALLAAWLIAMLSSSAFADQYVDMVGGPGGGRFEEHCPGQEILVGLELRTGDDVDAVRPLCAPAHGAAARGPVSRLTWHGGEGGGNYVDLLCPEDLPAIQSIFIYSEGLETEVVNTVELTCDHANGDGQVHAYKMQSFQGPVIRPERADLFFFPVYFGNPDSDKGEVACVEGQVATGIQGRSGRWLDALGLICGDPRFYIGSIGRVPDRDKEKPRVPPVSTSVNPGGITSAALSGHTSTTLHPHGALGIEPAPPPKPRPPICDAARDAIARQSPAAPNLEAQCRAAGGTP